MLLALVDTDFKFLWFDVGSSGSSSDAPIFNCSKLKKIKDGTLGLLALEPLGEGWTDLRYFLMEDDTFTLMTWLVKAYSRRQLTRKEKIASPGAGQLLRMCLESWQLKGQKLKKIKVQSHLQKLPKFIKSQSLFPFVEKSQRSNTLKNYKRCYKNYKRSNSFSNLRNFSKGAAAWAQTTLKGGWG